jgi:P27 family predicted phage terminase small subunit
LITGSPNAKLRDTEPQPKKPRNIPTPPSHLLKEAKQEWKRTAPQLYHLNLLTGADRAGFGAYCQAYGRWVLAERALAKMAERDQVTDALMIRTTNGNTIQNPLVGTANKAMHDMMRYAVEFGLTPSARSRMEIERGPEQTTEDQKYLR